MSNKGRTNFPYVYIKVTANVLSLQRKVSYHSFQIHILRMKIFVNIIQYGYDQVE